MMRAEDRTGGAMRDRLLARIRTHMEARTETPPCPPHVCEDAYCRNGNWCTLYAMPLDQLHAETCELGVYAETFSFLDVLREVSLSLSMRSDKKDYEYECSLLYNACIHALEGKGRYTLTLEENRCKTCAHRKDDRCEVLGSSPPDCDSCNCYTPLNHEHTLFDPLCF